MASPGSLNKVDAVKFLITLEGRKLLEDLSYELTGKNLVQVIAKYRKIFDVDIVALAIEIVQMRKRAVTKFSNAGEMFFDKAGYEQASGEILARHKAERFEGKGLVLDLGCGIGADTIALARMCEKVVAFDIDTVRLLMCQENCKVSGVKNVEFVCGDFTKQDLKKYGRIDAIYIDPARRTVEKRVFDPDEYSPSLSYVDEILMICNKVCVKVSPGIDYEMLRETTYFKGRNVKTSFEVEIVSHKGECKEALLWFGDFVKNASRKATILPEDVSLKISDTDDAENTDDIVKVTDIKKYIHEPDAAVIRAHLVQELAKKYKYNLIDSEIAYLTSNSTRKSAFLTSYKVLEVLSVDVKKIKSALNQRKIKSITVKKRGFSQSPQEFINKLKVKEGDDAILFITVSQGKHVAILTEKV